MKTKIVVLVGIALCTMLLISPALASDAGTLEIYGNANEDDTIDMRDLTYVKLIFFGKKPETELADAKYDGKINPLDFIQIKLIIVGKEKELTIVDGADRIVTIGMPIERIAGLHSGPCIEFCKLGVQDRVVGVTLYVFDDLDLHPGLAGKANIGSVYEPYYEVIAEAKPDVLIMTASSHLWPVVEKLEPLGIKVVALNLCTHTTYESELKQLGYMLDKEERVGGFIEWSQEIRELLKDRTKDLKDEEKVRIFATGLTSALRGGTEFYPDFTRGKTADRIIKEAGGINIAGELPEGAKVSGEWILKENPEVIILSSFYTKEGFGYTVTDTTLAKQSLRQILEHEVLGKTEAAKNGNVWIFSYYGIVSGGSGGQLGPIYLAKRIYPERFGDIDPEEFHREYFEKWFHIKYQGVWAYP